MIKKTITYEDYDGNQVSEDFYFGLTKLELLEMDIAFEGGISSHIEKLTKTSSGVEVYNLFKDVLLKSVGKKSADGRRFIKKDPDTGILMSDDFEASPAMSELIFGFISDVDKAIDFINGLMPASLVREVEEENAKRKDPVSLVADSDTPVTPAKSSEKKELKKISEYTEEELLSMPQEDFDIVAGTDPSKMNKPVLVIAMKRKTRV